VSLTVLVPGGSDATWHGLRDGFCILRSPCLFGGPGPFETEPVGQAYADACDRISTGAIDVDTPPTAIVALARLQGLEVSGPTDVSLAG